MPDSSYWKSKNKIKFQRIAYPLNPKTSQIITRTAYVSIIIDPNPDAAVTAKKNILSLIIFLPDISLPHNST